MAAAEDISSKGGADSMEQALGRCHLVQQRGLLAIPGTPSAQRLSSSAECWQAFLMQRPCAYRCAAPLQEISLVAAGYERQTPCSVQPAVMSILLAALMFMSIAAA